MHMERVERLSTVERFAIPLCYLPAFLSPGVAPSASHVEAFSQAETMRFCG